MGENNQNGILALSVSLFVSFHGDLYSKLALTEKYTKHGYDTALFFLLKYDSIYHN